MKDNIKKFLPWILDVDVKDDDKIKAYNQLSGLMLVFVDHATDYAYRKEAVERCRPVVVGRWYEGDRVKDGEHQAETL